MSVVYVLTNPMPDDGGDNPTMDQVRRRAKWDNDDYVCRGLIVNGMFNSLFDIYQNVETSKELWDTLEAKYMAEDASIKKFLISNFKNYKITDSRPVLKQYIELIGMLRSHIHIEESLKVLDIDKPKGNNVSGPSVVNMVEHNNSSRKPRHLKKDYKASNVSNKANGSGTKGSDDDVAWWVDSGATVHVCKDRCWFKTYVSLNDRSILHMVNESTALVHGHGYVDLRFSSGKVVCLLNVLHVLNISRTGKTFVYNTVMARLRSERMIVLAVASSVGKGNEQTSKNLNGPASDAALRVYYDKYCHQLLPIIAEKVHQEKVQQEKLKEVKAPLIFEGCSGLNSKVQEMAQHSESKTPNVRGSTEDDEGTGQKEKEEGTEEYSIDYDVRERVCLRAQKAVTRFDDLPPEPIDSYDDLKKAFLENYLQQKKCIKDPVEIHHIKQREGESTKDFVQRRKNQSGDSSGISRLDDCNRLHPDRGRTKGIVRITQMQPGHIRLETCGHDEGATIVSGTLHECPRRVSSGQTKEKKPSTRKEQSNTRRSRKACGHRHHERSMVFKPSNGEKA
nr:zinc finger, CCHC-type [Tanacetum cinerariifolium]